MKLSTFRLTHYFFLLTGAILTLFGVGSLLRIKANPDLPVLYVMYAILMFAGAAVLLFCALRLNKRSGLIFCLPVIVLTFNIIPTIFDQFGMLDLLFLSLNLVTLVLLIISRREFLSA